MKFSVIIPGYNTTPSQWERCINSVKKALNIAQCEGEIICIDDGSQDHAEFLHNRSDIIFLQQENMGPSAARNMGLRMAKGEWVSFVDSDDMLFSEVYQRALIQAKKFESDVVVFGVQTVWPDIKCLKNDVVHLHNIDILSPEKLCVLKENCLLNYCWNKIYKRNFLLANNIEFPVDIVMGEDLFFNLKCAVSMARWSSISYIGYKYYRTSDTLLSRYIINYESGLLQVNEMWYMYAQKMCEVSRIKKYIKSDYEILNLTWENMWKHKSPYSMLSRWNWLASHPNLGSTISFFKMCVYTFLRKHFYFGFLRRWHIQGLYPTVKCEV